MKQCTLNTETAVQFFDNQPRTIQHDVCPQPGLTGEGVWQWNNCQWESEATEINAPKVMMHCPDKPGEILWVEELPGMTEKSARLFLEVKDAVMTCSGKHRYWNITYGRVSRNEALAACAGRRAGRAV